MVHRSQFADRIDDLADAASEARERMDPAEIEAESTSVDVERVSEIVSEGVGPTVALYCEARTGGTMARFGEAEFERLEAALNDWLWCYAACHGEDVTVDATIREAAELLVDTHDADAIAQILTGVSER